MLVVMILVTFSLLVWLLPIHNDGQKQQTEEIVQRLLSHEEVSMREFRDCFPTGVPIADVAISRGYLDHETAKKYLLAENIVVHLVKTPPLVETTNMSKTLDNK